MAKFLKSRDWDKVLEGNTVIFKDTLYSLKCTVAWLEQDMHAKHLLDPYFDTIDNRHTPRQTDRQTHNNS